MKNILVTGANGQLGNEMRILSESYPQYRYFTDTSLLMWQNLISAMKRLSWIL